MKTDVTSAQTIKEQIYKAFSSFFPLNYPSSSKPPGLLSTQRHEEGGKGEDEVLNFPGR